MKKERERATQTPSVTPPANGGVSQHFTNDLASGSRNHSSFTAQPKVLNENAVTPPTFKHNGPQNGLFVLSDYSSPTQARLTPPPTQSTNSPAVGEKDLGSLGTHRKTRR